MVVAASCCEVFFSGRDWKTGQGKGKNEWRKIINENVVQSTQDLRLETMTLNTQPGQYRSGFGTTVWMSYSGPARVLTQTHSNISGETWKWLSTDAPHPTWHSLRGATEKNGITFHAQVCKACHIIPKKTPGCNPCQWCFNKALTKGSEYLCQCDISVFPFNTFAKIPTQWWV